MSRRKNHRTSDDYSSLDQANILHEKRQRTKTVRFQATHDGKIVEKILDSQVVNGTTRYLVKWKDVHPLYATWHSADELDCPQAISRYKNTCSNRKTVQSGSVESDDDTEDSHDIEESHDSDGTDENDEEVANNSIRKAVEETVTVEMCDGGEEKLFIQEVIGKEDGKYRVKLSSGEVLLLYKEEISEDVIDEYDNLDGGNSHNNNNNNTAPNHPMQAPNGSGAIPKATSSPESTSVEKMDIDEDERAEASEHFMNETRTR